MSTSSRRSVSPRGNMNSPGMFAVMLSEGVVVVFCVP